MSFVTGGLLDWITRTFEISFGSGDRATDSGEAIRNRVDTLIGTPAADVSDDIAAVKTVVDGITSSDATIAKQNTIISNLATAQADLDNPSQYKSDATLAMQNTISGKHTVPSANATANIDVSDVGGNKTDTAVTTVSTTKSIIAYVKGIVNQVSTIITNIAVVKTDTGKIPKSDGSVVWNGTAQTTIQTKAAAALSAYDPPTRAEATSDKDAIITQVNANETKIDTISSSVITKGDAFNLVFPIFNTSQELITSAADLDSEISKDGGGFTDCGNEATEIGSTGLYTLILTGTEMTADYIAIKVTTTSSDAVNPIIIIYTTA